MIERILKIVSEIPVPGFFIVSDIVQESECLPQVQNIELFINNKFTLIQKGISGRKFKYKQDGWIIIFTFFPTDRVVEEKYALKNKIIKEMNKS